MRKSQFGFLSLALLLSLGGGVGAQPPLTVISGGTLIDGRGGAPLRDAVIVIAGNRIQAVGPRSAVQAPAGATVINAAGKFVVPGLFDTHVHYQHWAAELMLHYGITSIIDVGNELEWILAMKEGTAKGKVFGPRIFPVGPLVSTPPGDPPRCCGGIGGVTVNNPAEATKVARALIAKGVDGIKLYQQDPPSAMRPDVVAAFSAETRKAGIPLMADVDHHVMNARDFVSAGLNVIIHAQGLAMATIKDPAKLAAFKAAPNLSNTNASPATRGSKEPWYLTDPADYDDLVRFLVERKVAIQPTSQYLWMSIHPLTAQHAEETRQLSLDPGLSYLPRSARATFFRRIDDGGRMDDFTPEQVTQLRQGYEKFKQFHRKFAAAGGLLIPGTDGPGQGLVGLGLHNELELLGLEAGLSPLQIITAATKNPAEVLGKGDLLGTIEAGKLADLLIVKQDPLVDIRNLRNSLEVVMQDGKVIDRRFHPNFTSPYPRPQADLRRGGAPTMISPEVVTEGSASFTLIVTPLTTGAQFLPRVGPAMFTPGATVQFDGQDLATEFVNRRELRAQVPANLVAKPGVYLITVRDPRAFFPDTAQVTFVVKFK